MKIKLLPYESCLRIGKLLQGEFNFNHEDDFVDYLPKSIFDTTQEVMESSQNYFMTTTEWFVRPAFVSYIIH